MPTATDPAPWGWSIILPEEQVQAARATIDEIIEALESWYRREKASLSPEWTLGGGLAGASLFFHYLDRSRPGDGYGEFSRELFASACEAAEASGAGPSLIDGLSGIGWLDAHFARRDGALLGDYSDLEAAIEREIDRWPPEGHFDLITGIAGFGIYLLERLPDPRCRLLLEALTARLCATAVRDDAGIAWFTGPYLLRPDAKSLYPNGRFDLGVAHGSAGVRSGLGFLNS